VLGSTSNFDFPPEELDKFAKDHNLNGGSAGASTEDSDDDDYNENLVYVSSPKVCSVGICFDSQRLLHTVHFLHLLIAVMSHSMASCTFSFA